MKERTNLILVTFHGDVTKNEIYDYFDSFGNSISYYNEIPRLLLKRYAVDVPESKVEYMSEQFKSNDTIVLSAHVVNVEAPKKFNNRFDKSR